MAANGDDNVRVRWNGSIGPAFIAGCVQIVIGIFVLGIFYETMMNTRSTADKLQTIVDKQQDAQGKISERLVSVETSVNIITSTISRMDTKLDAIAIAKK